MEFENEYFQDDKRVENYHAIRTMPDNLRKIFDRKNEILDDIREYLFYGCKSEKDVDLFEKLMRITIENVRDVDM